MVKVFWNSGGLYVNRLLESSTSFNSAYFTDYVLSDIESLPSLQMAVQQKKKFVLQMDNSPVHKSRVVTEKVASLRIALALHPSYSPDLARSGFFLFGYLKEKMVGIDFESRRDLIDWIQSTFETIPRHVLHEVFKSWLRRL
jgi:transposase